MDESKPYVIVNCTYRRRKGDDAWICQLHGYGTKHSVYAGLTVPCLKIDPREK